VERVEIKLEIIVTRPVALKLMEATSYEELIELLESWKVDWNLEMGTEQYNRIING